MKKISTLITSIALAIGLSGCGQEQQASNATANAAQSQQTFKWKLVTSWPKNYPGLGTAPERFAQNVEAMSNGRLKI